MARPSARRAVLVSLVASLSACGGSGGGSTADNPIDILPFLVTMTPTNGQTGVMPTEVVTVKFSEPMDPVTFTDSTFVLAYGATAVTGAITTSADQRTVSFTPSGPLNFDTLHTVTLNQGILSATGQPLTGLNSWIFTVHKPAWSQTEMSSDIGFYEPDIQQVAPDVAIDESENLVAVWVENQGSQLGVIFREWSVALGWQFPVQLDDGSGPALSPVVGIDSSGGVMVVWAVENSLWYARRVSGSAWQPPQELATVGAPPTPRQLMVDAAGNALLLYTQEQVGNNSFVVHFDATSGWETLEAIPDRYEEGLPEITMDRPSGFALVIWSEGVAPIFLAPGYQALRARRFIPGTGWTSDETVGPDEPNRVFMGGSLASDSQGNLVVSWLRQRTEGTQNPALKYDMEIHLRRCSVSGWGSDEMGPDTSDHDVFYRVDCALEPNGSATVMWWGWLNPVGALRARREVSPGNWGEQVLMDYLPGSDNSGLGVTQPFVGPGGRVGVIGAISFMTDMATGAGYGVIWVNESENGNWGQASVHRTAPGYVVTFKRACDSSGRAAVIWLEHTQSVPQGEGPLAVRISRYR